jgi:hypothetical protein
VSTAPPVEPAPIGPPANRGCWKGALYGCGAVAVCIVVVLVGLGIYVQKKPGAVTDLLMERIRDRYASDVTEQDKADLEAAYADFRAALEAKRVRRDDLDRVRATIRLGREVGHAEVVELTQIFRESAGTSPPPVAATPSP